MYHENSENLFIFPYVLITENLVEKCPILYVHNACVQLDARSERICNYIVWEYNLRPKCTHRRCSVCDRNLIKENMYYCRLHVLPHQSLFTLFDVIFEGGGSPLLNKLLRGKFIFFPHRRSFDDKHSCARTPTCQRQAVRSDKRHQSVLLVRLLLFHNQMINLVNVAVMPFSVCQFKKTLTLIE